MVDKISCSGPAGCRRERRVAIVAACTVLLFTEMTAEKAWAGALLPERGGSPNADRIASLYTVVLVLAALVFFGVAVALVYALRALPRAAQPGRGADPGQHAPGDRLDGRRHRADRVHRRLLADQAARDRAPRPRRGQSSRRRTPASCPQDGSKPLHIEVVGPPVHLAVPLSRRRLLLRGDGRTGRRHGRAATSSRVDVAHSWWIPKLGGKFDAIPGYVNHTWFRLRATRRLPRPVRRAVRAQPRRHARPGPRRRARPQYARG